MLTTTLSPAQMGLAQMSAVTDALLTLLALLAFLCVPWALCRVFGCTFGWWPFEDAASTPIAPAPVEASGHHELTRMLGDSSLLETLPALPALPPALPPAASAFPLYSPPPATPPVSSSLGVLDRPGGLSGLSGPAGPERPYGGLEGPYGGPYQAADWPPPPRVAGAKPYRFIAVPGAHGLVRVASLRRLEVRLLTYETWN